MRLSGIASCVDGRKNSEDDCGIRAWGVGQRGHRHDGSESDLAYEWDVLGTLFTTSYQLTYGGSSTNTYTAVIPYPGAYLLSFVSAGQTSSVGGYPRAIIYFIIDPDGTLTQGNLINNHVGISYATTGTLLTISQNYTGAGGNVTISVTRMA